MRKSKYSLVAKNEFARYADSVLSVGMDGSDEERRRAETRNTELLRRFDETLAPSELSAGKCIAHLHFMLLQDLRTIIDGRATWFRGERKRSEESYIAYMERLGNFLKTVLTDG